MQKLSTKEWLAMSSVGVALFLLIVGGCLLRARGAYAGDTLQPLAPVSAASLASPTSAALLVAAQGEGQKTEGSGSSNSSPSPAAPAPTSPSPAPSPSPEPELVVYVTGAVKKPGVYHLSQTARVYQAIDAAGGFAANAQQDALNLADHLLDADQIRVPTREDVTRGMKEPAISHGRVAGPGAAKAPVTTTATAAAVAAAPRERSDSGGSSNNISRVPTSMTLRTTSSKRSAAAAPKRSKLRTPGEGYVHLNSADADDLQRLPGVGKATAERILEYRHSNGRFRDPQELMNVSGIGEKKYAQMEPFLLL